MSDVSGVTNYFPTANEGFTSTLGSTISSAATTVPLTDVTGLTDGSVFVGIVEPGQTNQQVFTGTVDVSGSQVTGVVWTRGSNVGHAGGVTVVDYVTGTALNMITAGLLQEHNEPGTHGDVTADSVTVSGDATVTGDISGDAISGTSLTTTAAVTVGGDIDVSGWSKPTATSITSASTVTPSSSHYDVTALAANATIAAPSGTPTNRQLLLLRIKDNGTSRTLTYDAIYRAVGVSLPASTTISKTLYLGCIYNSADTKWDVVATALQA